MLLFLLWSLRGLFKLFSRHRRSCDKISPTISLTFSPFSVLLRVTAWLFWILYELRIINKDTSTDNWEIKFRVNLFWYKIYHPKYKFWLQQFLLWNNLQYQIRDWETTADTETEAESWKQVNSRYSAGHQTLGGTEKGGVWQDSDSTGTKLELDGSRMFAILGHSRLINHDVLNIFKESKL